MEIEFSGTLLLLNVWALGMTFHEEPQINRYKMFCVTKSSLYILFGHYQWNWYFYMDVKDHANEAQEASYKMDETYGIPFRLWMCDI